MKGKGPNNVGDLVIASGALSGEVGNNRIDDNQAMWWWDVNGVTWYMHGSLARQLNSRGAAGFGDSGGPVFVNSGGGVSARGIISGIDESKTGQCQGIQVQPCSWLWVYGDINGMVQDLNVTIGTG